MARINNTISVNNKHRLTSFIDPMLIKRLKVRGALEGLTLSEMVEIALDEYAPKIEKDADSHINVKFDKGSIPKAILPQIELLGKKIIPKHSKSLNVPRK